MTLTTRLLTPETWDDLAVLAAGRGLRLLNVVIDPPGFEGYDQA